MFAGKNDRPYFDAWLKRTGKQFAVSGRLTQTAMVLAAEEGGTVEDWRSRLRELMMGDDLPTLDLLTKIDALLAKPTDRKPPIDGHWTLF